MYVVNRNRHIDSAHLREVEEWAVVATARARAVTGTHIDTWMDILSPGDFLHWSFWDEDLEEVERVITALEADDEFARLTAEAEGWFVGGIEEKIRTMLHHSFVQGEHEARYLVQVGATITPGRYAEAIEAGKRMARHSTELTGRNTAFLLNFTGQHNGVVWVTGYPDLATIDRAERLLMADAEWQQLLHDDFGNFEPGGTRNLRRRLS